jgi:hypothetical protein
MPGGPRLAPHGASSRRLEVCAPRYGHLGTCQEPWVRPAAREGCQWARPAATAGSPQGSRRDGRPRQCGFAGQAGGSFPAASGHPGCRSRVFAPPYTPPSGVFRLPAHRERLSSEQSARSTAAGRPLRWVPYPPFGACSGSSMLPCPGTQIGTICVSASLARTTCGKAQGGRGPGDDAGVRGPACDGCGYVGRLIT